MASLVNLIWEHGFWSARMPDGHSFLSSFSFDFRHFTAASPDPQPDLECQVKIINHLKYAGLDNITWPHYHMILYIRLYEW